MIKRIISWLKRKEEELPVLSYSEVGENKVEIKIENGGDCKKVVAETFTESFVEKLRSPVDYKLTGNPPDDALEADACIVKSKHLAKQGKYEESNEELLRVIKELREDG